MQGPILCDPQKFISRHTRSHYSSQQLIQSPLQLFQSPLQPFYSSCLEPYTCTALLEQSTAPLKPYKHIYSSSTTQLSPLQILQNPLLLSRAHYSSSIALYRDPLLPSASLIALQIHLQPFQGPLHVQLLQSHILLLLPPRALCCSPLEPSTASPRALYYSSSTVYSFFRAIYCFSRVHYSSSIVGVLRVGG